MNGLGVDSEERRGGIGLLWKEDIKLEVTSYDKYHIDALVKTESG